MTLLLVAMAIVLGLAVGVPNATPRWARVWGGPTEGPAPLSLRVELGDTAIGSGKSDAESDGDESVNGAEARARLVVEDANGNRLEQQLEFDSERQAFVHLAQTEPTRKLTITRGDVTLASGAIRLTREEFWRQRRAKSGWLRGKVEGPLAIRVGYHEGGLALGMLGHLGIAISDAAGAPVRTALTLELDGLERPAAEAQEILRTDAAGTAVVAVVPRDMAAAVRIAVGPSDTPTARYYSSVPIEARGLFGKFGDRRLLVESLVPMNRAYYSIVDERGRWAVGSLALRCDATSRCRGETPLAQLPPGPAWLMLGSEPALDGPSVFGWPVVTSSPALVSDAVVVKERLLLDGKPAALAQAQRASRQRFRLIALGLLVVGLALGSAVLLALVRGRRSIASLDAALPDEAPRSIIQRRSVSGLAVFVLLVLGLGALAFWAKVKVFGH